MKVKKIHFFRLSQSEESKTPIQVSFIKDEKVIDESWFTLKKNDTIVAFDNKLYDFIEINKNKFTSEKTYKNNFSSFNKFRKPIRFVFLMILIIYIKDN